MLRFSLTRTLLIGFLAIPVIAGAQSYKVFTGSFGPRDEVRVSKPAFKWEIWPSQGEARSADVEFRIDGRGVPAAYNSSERAVIYNPSAALQNGTHRVDVAVTFEGQYKFNKSWTVSVSTISLASLPAASSSQTEAALLVNKIRERLLLPPVSQDNRLNIAAIKHSEYLTMNNMMGHYQVQGTKGFFGQTHMERLAAYGWGGGAWEGVTWGSQDVGDGIQQLFDAPYHRLPFLQPGSIAFGSGYAGTRMTCEFGASRETGTVISPANGERNVPTRWRNEETPNPLRVHSTAIKETGYPIVLAHFETGVRSIRVLRASVSAKGAEVPVFVNSAANDDQLQGAVLMIPQKPLQSKTTYTVNFKGTDNNGHSIDVTSTFTTL
jgi:uncharacterized protein YkwD